MQLSQKYLVFQSMEPMNPMVEKEQTVFMHFRKTIDGLIFDVPDQEFIQFVNYLS